MAGRASLRELMGAGGDKGGELRMADLGDILGDGMPDLPKNGVGRFRLIRALQQRFGRNFRSLPGVSGLIQEFDDDVEFDGVVSKLKGVKVQRSKNG